MLLLQDRRRHPRVRTRLVRLRVFSVSGKSGQTDLDAELVTSDISESGLRVELPVRVRPDDVVTFRAWVQDPPSVFLLCAIVRWIQPSEDGQRCTCGLELFGSDAFLADWRHCVKQVSARAALLPAAETLCG